MPTATSAFAQSQRTMFRRGFALVISLAVLALLLPGLNAQTKPSKNAAGIQRQVQEANARFTYGGKPIAAVALEDFGVYSIGETIYSAVAVDLKRETDDLHKAKGSVRKYRQYTYIESKYKEGDEVETDGYRYLGRLANGTQVLDTYSYGGGSGIFTQVVLVKIAPHQEYTDAGLVDRLVMTYLGEIITGDRFTGKITMTPTSVVIGRGHIAGELRDNPGRVIRFPSTAKLSKNAGEIKQQIEEANAHFTYKGKPIVAGVLHDIGEFTNPPRAAVAIDLNLTTIGLREMKTEVSPSDAGAVITTTITEENHPAQTYSYRYLGRLANGAHVLAAHYSPAGGLLVAGKVVLVKFVAHQEYGVEEFNPQTLVERDGLVDRIVMVRVGSFTLGDHYDGKVTVAPHRITIGAGRNHPQPKIIDFD